MCEGPAKRVLTKRRFRRGDREVEVVREVWECVRADHPDVDGEPPPVRWTDHDLGEVNDDRIHAAWLAKYGEPLPPARKPGRKTPRRTEAVTVPLTPTELEELDRQAAGPPRAVYVRRALKLTSV